jgi:hypothetical protein
MGSPCLGAYVDPVYYLLVDCMGNFQHNPIRLTSTMACALLLVVQGFQDVILRDKRLVAAGCPVNHTKERRGFKNLSF